MPHQTFYLLDATIRPPLPNIYLVETVPMRGHQLPADGRIHQVANLRSSVHLIHELQSLKGEYSDLPVRCSSPGSDGGFLRVEPDCLDRCRMLSPAGQLPHLSHRVQKKAVIIPSRCDQFSRRTYLQPTNLLVMSFIPHYFCLHSDVLNAHISISSPCTNQIVRTPNRPDPPKMQPFKLLKCVTFMSIKDFHLTISKAATNFIPILKKSDRADIIRCIISLINFFHLTHAP